MTEEHQARYLPILKDSNYDAWAVRARGYLASKKVWKAIDPGFAADESTWADADKDTNATALYLLQSLMSDNYLEDIAKTITAKEAWRILARIHKPDNLLSTALHLKAMARLEKDDATGMHDYIGKVQNYAAKLKNGGLEIPEKFLVMLILTGLPESYGNYVRSVRLSEEFTMEKIKSELLLEEIRLKEVEAKAGDEGKALFANYQNKSTGGKRQQRAQQPKSDGRLEPDKENNNAPQDSRKDGDSRSRSRGVKCFACEKWGHISRECQEKKRFGEPQDKGATKPKPAYLAQESDSETVLCVIHCHSASEAVKGAKNEWFLDSGASHHITPYRDKFKSYEEGCYGAVEVGTGKRVPSTGRGSVELKLLPRFGGGKIVLTQVLHVPDIAVNLLSVRRMEDRACEITFKSGEGVVTNQERLLLRAIHERGIYRVETEATLTEEAAHKALVAEATWHQRFGHMQKLPQGLTRGKTDDCAVCVEGKMKRSKFPVPCEPRTTEVLQIVHSDVCGPLRPQSSGGGKYFVTFIDDYSRYAAVSIMARKDEVLSQFKSFQARAERQHQPRKLVSLQSDNGGEYLSTDMETYLKEEGIAHRLTVPGNPQQNGVAERLNQTLLNMTRCMLIQSGMPKGFWGEAVSTACYLRNRCPSTPLGGRSPVEFWTGQRLKEEEVKGLRVFGCLTMTGTRGAAKLDSRAERCVFLGYQPDVKGYWLWDLQRRKIVVSRDIRCFEDVFPLRERIPRPEKGIVSLRDFDEETSDEQGNEETDIADREEPLDDDLEEEPVEEADGPREGELAPQDGHEQQAEVRRSARVKRQTGCPCCNYHVALNVRAKISGNANEPESYRQAMRSEDASEWTEAVQEEIKRLKGNETWEIVKRPEGRRVIGCKWVFKMKRDERGRVAKYKARLVALGHTQVPGVDYQETFSPVIRRRTLRIMVALSVELGWEIEHLDVESAYLNSTLEDIVYMEQPEGCEDDQHHPNTHVCLLRSSLYGLHQAGRDWNRFINRKLEEDMGMTRCVSDPCVYKSQNGNVIVGLYVDDIIVCGPTHEVSALKEDLKRIAKINDLGPVSNLLSLCVTRDERGVSISQPAYVREVLRAAGLEECRSVSTPVAIQRAPGDDDGDDWDGYEYRRTLGSLLYIANQTRPDISFPVGFKSQKCAKPSKGDWKEVKHILRYLKGTIECKLHYQRKNEPISVYVDADWGADREDRRSTSGYAIILAGAAVSWQSRKQKTVALSTVEAEYVAMCEVVKELCWIRSLLTELGQARFIETPCVVQADNQGAICLSKNETLSEKNKHMDIKFHFLREKVAEGAVKFKYVPSGENAADVLTKGVPGPRVKDCINTLGLNQ